MAFLRKVSQVNNLLYISKLRIYKLCAQVLRRCTLRSSSPVRDATRGWVVGASILGVDPAVVVKRRRRPAGRVLRRTLPRRVREVVVTDFCHNVARCRAQALKTHSLKNIYE